MAKQHKRFNVSSSLVVGALIGSTALAACEKNERTVNPVKVEVPKKPVDHKITANPKGPVPEIKKVEDKPKVNTAPVEVKDKEEKPKVEDKPKPDAAKKPIKVNPGPQKVDTKIESKK